MKNIITSEICQKCGGCCKNFPFVRLSQNEIYNIEKSTNFLPDVFSGKIDEAGDEYFLLFKENGDCFFLNENNGDFSCGIYKVRSKVCRDYPSNLQQDEICYATREMNLLKNSD